MLLTLCYVLPSAKQKVEHWIWHSYHKKCESIIIILIIVVLFAVSLSWLNLSGFASGLFLYMRFDNYQTLKRAVV